MDGSPVHHRSTHWDKESFTPHSHSFTLCISIYNFLFSAPKSINQRSPTRGPGPNSCPLTPYIQAVIILITKSQLFQEWHLLGSLMRRNSSHHIHTYGVNSEFPINPEELVLGEETHTHTYTHREIMQTPRLGLEPATWQCHSAVWRWLKSTGKIILKNYNRQTSVCSAPRI